MEEKVILYSNGCPRCNILKMKLDKSQIQYQLCNDEDLMIKKGFMSAPMLEINGEAIDFIEAIDWINERGNI